MGFGWAALGVSAALAAGQQPAEHVTVDPQSRIDVAGTLEGPFLCRSHELTGQGEMASSLGTRSTVPGLRRFELRVPVRSFSCGDAQTTLRFRNVLREGAFPMLGFRLEAFQRLPSPYGQSFRLQAEGTLTAAGRARRVRVPILGEGMPDGALRLTGGLPVRWEDFGIGPAGQPPASVRFDVRLRSGEKPQPLAEPPGAGD